MLNISHFKQQLSLTMRSARAAGLKVLATYLLLLQLLMHVAGVAVGPWVRHLLDSQELGPGGLVQDPANPLDTPATESVRTHSQHACLHACKLGVCAAWPALLCACSMHRTCATPISSHTYSGALRLLALTLPTCAVHGCRRCLA